ILPEKPSLLLEEMIQTVLQNVNYRTISNTVSIGDLRNKKILFAIELSEIGSSNNLNNIFLELYKQGKNSLLASEAALIIRSNHTMFTKTLAQSIIFLANNLGCSFIGRPLVEATKNLE